MSSQILLLDRIEFLTVKIQTNSGEFHLDKNFPQLQIDAESFTTLIRSDLIYPDEQLSDPRNFLFTYGVRITNEKGFSLPYDIEIEAACYFNYIGGNEFEGEHRFRAVRFSGYQILHGAIREMASNITARSRHGLWNLPAQNFGRIAESQASEDEVRRKAALVKLTEITALESPKKQQKVKSNARPKREIP